MVFEWLVSHINGFKIIFPLKYETTIYRNHFSSGKSNIVVIIPLLICIILFSVNWYKFRKKSYSGKKKIGYILSLGNNDSENVFFFFSLTSIFVKDWKNLLILVWELKEDEVWHRQIRTPPKNVVFPVWRSCRITGQVGTCVTILEKI